MVLGRYRTVMVSHTAENLLTIQLLFDLSSVPLKLKGTTQESTKNHLKDCTRQSHCTAFVAFMGNRKQGFKGTLSHFKPLLSVSFTKHHKLP